MVTCVDISTLYPEKRGKSLILIETLSQFSHKHIVPILKYWVVEDMLIFIETEVPVSVSQWKTFCKKKFSFVELLDVFDQIC